MSNLDGLTSGISNKLVVSDPNGLVDVAIIQDFTYMPTMDVPDIVAMDGVTRHPVFFKGGSGSFTIQRGNSALDLYFARKQRTYLQGGDQVNATIHQYIAELDGTTSAWQLVDVVLFITDGGTFSGEDIVRQTIGFKCQERVPL